MLNNERLTESCFFRNMTQCQRLIIKWDLVIDIGRSNTYLQYHWTFNLIDQGISCFSSWNLCETSVWTANYNSQRIFEISQCRWPNVSKVWNLFSQIELRCFLCLLLFTPHCDHRAMDMVNTKPALQINVSLGSPLIQTWRSERRDVCLYPAAAWAGVLPSPAEGPPLWPMTHTDALVVNRRYSHTLEQTLA